MIEPGTLFSTFSIVIIFIEATSLVTYKKILSSTPTRARKYHGVRYYNYETIFLVDNNAAKNYFASMFVLIFLLLWMPYL